MKKYIIGLGCSWTQGEGGYPDEIVKQYNGRVQISNRCKDDYHLRKYEIENSWVNALCRDHFTDYIPVNLGVKGSGNIAAVQQLHFCDKVDFNNSTGIIVLMMSGFERFDVFHTRPYRKEDQDDFYSNNEYVHYKWKTAWPVPNDTQPFWEVYSRDLWSEQFVASHQITNLLNLQNFAKAYGYKVVVANAFNQPRFGVYNYFKEHTGSVTDKFDWDTYVHNSTSYVAFMEKLVAMDGLLPVQDWGSFYDFYRKRDWPAKYLTNCDGAHPTIEGYKVIADELASFIKLKGYA